MYLNFLVCKAYNSHEKTLKCRCFGDVFRRLGGGLGCILGTTLGRLLGHVLDVWREF